VFISESFAVLNGLNEKDMGLKNGYDEVSYFFEDF